MYDLHKLGWDSFQRLCFTISTEILGQTVESFLNTRDGGRDGAFTGTWVEDGREDLSGQFVIQCKFTSKTDYNLKISDLSDEFGKARKLADQGRCDSYVLMTNAGLLGNVEMEIGKRLEAVGVKHFRVYGSDWINQQILESKRLRTLVPRVYGLGDLSQILDERAYDQSRAVLEFLREDIAKVIVTDVYQKAVNALNEHRFVLLVGEPAAGKTTIASLLAMAELDQRGSLVLKLDDPRSITSHWNTHEHSQFFWVDDAFGVTQYEAQLVREWNHNLGNIKAMLSRGARIVLTSRDYIYNHARKELKIGAFPLLNESQVVVDVHALSLNEKRQILYNHIKLGNQPNQFRREIKPHLERLARHAQFIPEIARRLADPMFTGGLLINESELDRFVGEPEAFLKELLTSLDTDSKAALALVYMRNGSLDIPITIQTSEHEALSLLGSERGRIRMALEALEGSFVLHSMTDEQPAWRFKHPTISDSYSTILAESPDLLDIFIQGSASGRLIRQVTCGNVGIENAIVIPSPLFPQMLAKLDEMSSSEPHKSPMLSQFQARESLQRFLSSRCSQEFLSLYTQHNPGLLDQISEPGMFLEFSSGVSLAKRLYELGLFPEKHRQRFVSTVSEYLIDGDDGSALYDRDVQALFADREFDALIQRVKTELLPVLGDVREQWESNYDSDHEPEHFMGPLYDLYRDLRKQFEEEQDLIELIDREEQWTSQWIADHLPDEDDIDPRKLEGAQAQDTLRSERSIFDDIDQ